jgi:hypothetical protein
MIHYDEELPRTNSQISGGKKLDMDYTKMSIIFFAKQRYYYRKFYSDK